MNASNMGLMNRLVEYVRQKGECSLGEVEVQLGIPIWKQYVLARAYRGFFQDVRLEPNSFWQFPAEEPHVRADESVTIRLIYIPVSAPMPPRDGKPLHDH